MYHYGTFYSWKKSIGRRWSSGEVKWEPHFKPSLEITRQGCKHSCPSTSRVLGFFYFFLKRWRAGRFQACLHFKQSAFLDLIFPSQPDFKPPLTNSTNPAYQGSGFQFLSSVICSLWHMTTLLITPQYLGISQDPRYNISTTIISKDDSQLQSSGYTQRQMHAHINRTFFWTCEKL